MASSTVVRKALAVVLALGTRLGTQGRVQVVLAVHGAGRLQMEQPLRRGTPHLEAAPVLLLVRLQLGEVVPLRGEGHLAVLPTLVLRAHGVAERALAGHRRQEERGIRVPPQHGVAVLLQHLQEVQDGAVRRTVGLAQGLAQAEGGGVPSSRMDGICDVSFFTLI
jgi:hypothetical protein